MLMFTELRMHRNWYLKLWPEPELKKIPARTLLLTNVIRVVFSIQLMSLSSIHIGLTSNTLT